jgi:hypothetical protein
VKTAYLIPTQLFVSTYFKINGDGWVRTGTFRLLCCHHYWNTGVAHCYILFHSTGSRKFEWLAACSFVLINFNSFSFLVMLKVAVFWVVESVQSGGSVPVSEALVASIIRAMTTSVNFYQTILCSYPGSSHLHARVVLLFGDLGFRWSSCLFCNQYFLAYCSSLLFQIYTNIFTDAKTFITKLFLCFV